MKRWWAGVIGVAVAGCSMLGEQDPRWVGTYKACMDLGPGYMDLDRRIRGWETCGGQDACCATLADRAVREPPKGQGLAEAERLKPLFGMWCEGTRQVLRASSPECEQFIDDWAGKLGGWQSIDAILPIRQRDALGSYMVQTSFCLSLRDTMAGKRVPSGACFAAKSGQTITPLQRDLMLRAHSVLSQQQGKPKHLEEVAATLATICPPDGKQEVADCLQVHGFQCTANMGCEHVTPLLAYEERTAIASYPPGMAIWTVSLPQNEGTGGYQVGFSTADFISVWSRFLGGLAVPVRPQ